MVITSIQKAMIKRRDSLILHEAQIQPIRDLSYEEKGKIFEAVVAYQFEGKVPDLPPMLEMAFRFFKNQLDIDNDKFFNTCERNRKNGSKGGRRTSVKEEKPKKSSGLIGNPKNPDEPQKSENDNDNVNENGNGKELMAKRKRFTPPKFSEFEKYFLENGFDSLLASRAFKGYEEANWHDSKGNKITNWKQKCQHVWFKPENRKEPIPVFKPKSLSNYE